MRFSTVSLALAAALVSTSAMADVTVYSAGPGGLIKKLAAGFEKESGIKVNVFQATTGKVMARVEAEASNPSVDVVVSASWGTAEDYDGRGWIMPYDSPNAVTVPDMFKKDGAVAQGAAALAIAWNTGSGTPKPTDWSDLAKPEFKDKVNMPDPSKSGTAYELTAAIAGNMGWGLFSDLAANDMNAAGANKAALNPVLQGAKAAVFGAVDYIALAARAKGETVDVIFPESGTVVAPRPIMIMKWTQNEADAKKFVDYMLSDEGQEAVASVYLMPARTDIKASRPTISELKLLGTPEEPLAREEVLAKFSEIFAK